MNNTSIAYEIKFTHHHETVQLRDAGIVILDVLVCKVGCVQKFLRNMFDRIRLHDTGCLRNCITSCSSKDYHEVDHQGFRIFGCFGTRWREYEICFQKVDLVQLKLVLI